MEQYLKRLNEADLNQVNEALDKLVMEVAGDDIFDSDCDPAAVCRAIRELIKKKL